MVDTMVTHPNGTHSDRLSPDAVERLALEYHEDRRPEIRDRIAASFDWLVVLCANHARWHDEPVDDLAQVARVGLLAAIERFDPGRGVTLHTYAERTMVGTIRHYHRSALQPKVPRSLQDLNASCRSAVERLTNSLNHTPTAAEVAEHVGVDDTDVTAALAVDNLFHPVSLSTTSSGDATTTLEDRLSIDDFRIESIGERAEIHDALISLPSRQRTILFLHFYDGRTQGEIGARLGISQVQVSRLMTAALEVLRDRVAPPGDPEACLPRPHARQQRREMPIAATRQSV
jgi:RNA polymerase sigma-B factor